MKAPERCAKYGIKNQEPPLSGWKQFTCAKFSYFFDGSVKPFTDYFLDFGGFTSRADCFALLRGCCRPPCAYPVRDYLHQLQPNGFARFTRVHSL